MEADGFTIEGAPMAKGSTVTIQKMQLNKIKLNKNSRLNIDPEELDGLMQSIKETGLLQPIGVIKNGAGYEICYGNRRFLACSKLGMATIPVIVHEKKKDSDADIKNLTENIQRRNISLAETGRYIELLQKQGLSSREAAVRLGVTTNYVDSCLTAFRSIPSEFRDDIEIRVVKDGRTKETKTAPGKISISTAQKIVSAQKSGYLDRAQTRELLRAAKSEERFSASKVDQYINAMASKRKDWLSAVERLKVVRLSFLVSKEHYESLEKKFVENGPFKSVNELLYAVLKGEKSVKIEFAKEL